MKNKKFLIIALSILAVGFAAVSTTLYITGKTLIGVNTDDFEVYFSSAILDDVDKSNELISDNKKEIDFTTSLTKLNETSELEFEITNASTQYDADVSISCILSITDYLSFTTDKSLYEVKAQTRENGLLTVKLDKVSTNELNQTISCTLVATAKELDKAAEVVLKDTTYQITGTGEPNTTYVVYSDTPHIVETDDYGFFYVSGLEKGSHEIYYLGETSEDLTSKTKDEIKSLAIDKTNITTSSTSIRFSNTSFSDFVVEPTEDTSEVTVNLNSNGGIISNEMLTLNKYTKISDLEIPSRTSNYQFDGWYEGNKKITDNTIITSDMNIEAKWTKLCDYEEGQVWTFEYTGDEQSFIASCEGTYKVELWGAQGGSVYGFVGGAYTSGNIFLNSDKEIYVYVGANGIPSGSSSFVFNYGYHNYSSNGGGSTDIRLVNGTWNTLSSLTSRIMVAAGGGSDGGLNSYDGGSPYGGSAGGLTGYQGGACISNNVTSHSGAYGATQTSGHAFGQVLQTNLGGNTIYNTPGGNGYWSGNYYNWTGVGGHSAVSGAGGGSSYISGHTGCVAIASSTSTSPKSGCANGTTDINCSYHYSGYKFTNTVMVDGNGYSWSSSKGSYTGMPSHDGLSTISGNSGNGYAKITLVSID